MATAPEFSSTITSDFSGDEHKNNVGLFQNNSQMASFSDFRMCQVYNVSNDYEQSRNFNTFASGDTGIKIRNRQVRNEQPAMNSPDQGTASRRIRLVTRCALGSNEVVKDGSCAQEHDSKPVIAGVRSLFI